jgi:hypothetical protein|tara:strand:- start:2222 stop:2635 length:414 start_codon:yes stop_codon:yes gene_type:complete
MSNLKTELEALRYMDLKDKFIELGIGEAFKAGTKKVLLIERAVELMAKKDSFSEELTVEQVNEEIKKDEVVVEKAKLSEFDKAVKAVTSTEGIWTKETIAKRITILGNIFAQHRNTVKGTEAIAKQEVLTAAAKLMF